MESVNGKVGFSDKGPIYLAYVDRVPDLEAADNYNPPPGALLVPNFLSEAEATELMEVLHFAEMPEDGGGGGGGGVQELKHRQVKHFGYEFDYKINNIGK